MLYHDYVTRSMHATNFISRSTWSTLYFKQKFVLLAHNPRCDALKLKKSDKHRSSQEAFICSQILVERICNLSTYCCCTFLWIVIYIIIYLCIVPRSLGGYELLLKPHCLHLKFTKINWNLFWLFEIKNKIKNFNLNATLVLLQVQQTLQVRKICWCIQRCTASFQWTGFKRVLKIFCWYYYCIVWKRCKSNLPFEIYLKCIITFEIAFTCHITHSFTVYSVCILLH